MISNYLPAYDKTVVFEGENGMHNYYLDGVEKPSVTTIEKATGLAESFPNTAAVMAAVEFGNLVHGEIDTFEKTGKKGLTQEFRNWLQIRNMAEHWQTEVVFATERFAGTVDAVGKSDDGYYVIVDHKTGAVPDCVAYQLSFYEMGLKASGLIPDDAMCLLFVNITKENKLQQVTNLPVTELGNVLDAYEEGVLYEKPYSLVALDDLDYCENMKIFADIARNALKRDDKILVEAMLDNMVNGFTWESILDHMPAAKVYEIATDLKKKKDKFDKQLKAQMVAEGMSRAKTTDGYLWTLSEYDQEKFSLDDFRIRYKHADRMIEKCKKTTHCVRLNFCGKEKLVKGAENE